MPSLLQYIHSSLVAKSNELNMFYIVVLVTTTLCYHSTLVLTAGAFKVTFVSFKTTLPEHLLTHKTHLFSIVIQWKIKHLHADVLKLH